MEDKYQDKKTVDQAWGMMRATLDAELPLEKRRRGAIWWWGFASLGAASLLLWFTFGGSTTPILDTAPQQEEEPKGADKIIAANQSIKILNEPISISQKPKSSSLINSIQKSQKINIQHTTVGSGKAKPESSIVEKTLFNSNPLINIRNKKQISDQDKGTPIASNLSNTIAPTNPKLEKPKPIAQNTKIQKSISQTLKNEEPAIVYLEKQNSQTVKTIISLPNLTINPLDVGEKKWSKKIDLLKIKKWNLGIQLHTLVHNRTRVLSNNLELTLGRRLHPRWNAGLGLGYKFYRINFARNSDPRWGAQSNGQGAFDPDLPIQQEADLFAAGELDFFGRPQSVNLHYITMSAFVEYKLMHRWNILAGLRFNGIVNNSEGSVITFADASTSMNNAIETFSRNKKSPFKNYFELYLSPAYRLSSHLMLGLTAHYSPDRFRFIGKKEPGRYKAGLFIRYTL